MIEQVVNWLVQTIGQWGYLGIIILMFLESSFFPFPSEVVITPAGFLAAKKVMNIWIVILSGTIGSLLGALFNYWLALRLGRPFFEKYGHVFLVSQKSLQKADIFFQKHGHISTFIARLLPGIRQYISLPAGLTKMNLYLFCLYTSLGAGIWVVVLACIGYCFGRNQALIEDILGRLLLILIPACVLIIALYVWRYRKKRSKHDK